MALASESPLVSTPRIGVAEYLAIEQRGTTKHEYHDGAVIAMPGASPSHVRVTRNLSHHIQGEIGNGDYEYLDQDVQVLIPELNTYTYPDGAVACPPAFSEGPTAVLLNPRVVFEVLSPSTEAYDRGLKFRNYQRVATLEEYVLIATEESVVEVFQKPEWGVRTYEGLDAVADLVYLGIRLPLRALYAKVFPSPMNP